MYKCICISIYMIGFKIITMCVCICVYDDMTIVIRLKLYCNITIFTCGTSLDKFQVLGNILGVRISSVCLNKAASSGFSRIARVPTGLHVSRTPET